VLEIELNGKLFVGGLRLPKVLKNMI
jgi:hypothetical protein